jgi:tetratricopeptide (TPR) repeat protein
MNRAQRRAEKKTGQQPQASSVGPLLIAALRHLQAGQLAKAQGFCRQARAIDPRNSDASHLLGVVAHQTGHPEDAIDLIGRAIALNAAEPTYHCNLGLALKELGRMDEAIACYLRAIDLRPDYPEAHNSLGNALAEKGEPEQAADAYRQAIRLRPAYPEAYFNLGLTQKEHGELDEAIASYRRAIELRPEYHEAYYNLGNALRDQRRLREAVASYRAAIQIAPDFPDAHHNAALAILALGDLRQGWAEYEWRWRTSQLSEARREFAQPQWHGEDVKGRTLLIHAEQGFGDTLQFCRYAKMAAGLGARVILEVQQPLVRLLRGLIGTELVLARGEELPPFDVHCPMLSLPLVFGTVLETIPAETPYLRADASLEAGWRKRLDSPDTSGPKIGLVWAGKSSNLADQRRSIAPERLRPLLEYPGIRFFSLQKIGPPAPADFPLIDVMDEMEDFADTAALIANLDLVISVDTAVAHLAASLGRPVWLLDRFDACWRWLADRTDSPWYPGLRIYRQPRPGDWVSVLANVVRDLRERPPFSLASAARV